MWEVHPKHTHAPGAPDVILVVHSEDRTDDRVLRLTPAEAIDLARDLLTIVTNRWD